MTHKQLNRKAVSILRKLRALQQEAENLIEDIDQYSDGEEYDYYFRNLKMTLDELASFDLEDSIEAERYL